MALCTAKLTSKNMCFIDIVITFYENNFFMENSVLEIEMNIICLEIECNINIYVPIFVLFRRVCTALVLTRS